MPLAAEAVSGNVEALTPKPQAAPTDVPDGDADMQQMSRDRIEALEVELRYTKENLQTTIEELETSNEELQAANEELVTSNEELQSTNEELQSVNEELFTVNAEYQKKIAELSELSSDMDNLLASTEVGTIFSIGSCASESSHRKSPRSFICCRKTLAGGSTALPMASTVRSSWTTSAECWKRTALEIEVQDHQGTWQYLRILPYRVKAKVDGVVLTLIDISQIRKVQAALSDAVRRRDQFLAMLSHELRNPLGAILNASIIIQRSPPADEKLRWVGEVVLRQSQHMTRLLDDLLDVSRITQNKIEMKKQPTPIATIVDGALESVRPLIESTDLKFSEDISHRSMMVNGDPVRLQRRCRTCLSTPSNTLPPAVKSGSKDSHSMDMWCFESAIRVSGFLPDQIDSIFDLFVQSGQTLSRSKGGMGVGLTLVRSILEQHGGSVIAHGAGPGQGSQFELRLPRLPENSDSSRSLEQDGHAQPCPTRRHCCRRGPG